MVEFDMGPRLPISKALADELISLAPAERVELVYDIWESIEADSGDVKSVEVQSAYAHQRLAEYRRDPSTMVAWEDFVARLHSSSE